MSDKPLLLLDVDGVLCPFVDAEGYERLDVGHQEAVLVSKSNISRLKVLASFYELTWATAWEEEANKLLAPWHELGPLPVITFGTEQLGGRIYLPAEVRHYRGSTWKLPWIQRHVNQRPFAWIDDDIQEDAYEWAEKREAPTLLVRTHCDHGFTEKEFEALLEFGKSQKAPANEPV